MSKPDPAFFDDWKDWARALLQSAPETPPGATQLVPYPLGALPSAKQDYLLIAVLDGADAYPAMSQGGAWYRVELDGVPL